VVSFTSQPLYTRRKILWYPLDSWLGGPHIWSGQHGEEVILSRSLLRHYAESLKVAGSIPDRSLDFSLVLTLPAHYGRRSDSTTNRNAYQKSSWGKGRPVRKPAAASPSMSRFSRKCGSLDIWQPYGPPRPVTGISLPFDRDSNSDLSVVQPVSSHYTDCTIPAKWDKYLKKVFLSELSSEVKSLEQNAFHSVT
jgi:hypothetical protein